MYREDIILKAAIELNPEYLYEFERGTHGFTLYVRAPDKQTAHKIRAEIPFSFEGYPTIVTYHYDRDALDRE